MPRCFVVRAHPLEPGLQLAARGESHARHRLAALEPGESLFLCEPSGCGKSTLLSAIAGAVAVPPDAIRVGGTDIGALRGSARGRFRSDHLGAIFQVFDLVRWLSAPEQRAAGDAVFGAPKQAGPRQGTPRRDCIRSWARRISP